jgi:transposase InsO family protein
VDQGPDFTSRRWIGGPTQGIDLKLIAAGTPTQNVCIESSNGSRPVRHMASDRMFGHDQQVDRVVLVRPDQSERLVKATCPDPEALCSFFQALHTFALPQLKLAQGLR